MLWNLPTFALLTAAVTAALHGFATAAPGPTTFERRVGPRAEARIDPRAGANQYVGYLFLHFYDNYKSPGDYTTYPAGERVFGHLSNGNDPLSYHALNGGAPLLTSTVGTRGVRDFYLVSEPDESRHWIIATDLNQTAAGGFGGKFLSRNLVIWDSKGSSLTQWSAPRLVEVVPENFRMAWAPEAVYDKARGQFMVFWSSNRYNDSQHTGSPDKDKVYRSYTSDFKTFTPAELYSELSDGASTIDMTIHPTGGSARPNEYVRFQKREDLQKCFGEISHSGLDGPWERIGSSSSFVNSNSGAGEACLFFQSNTNASDWYVFVDQYGRSPPGYYPYRATNGITQDGYEDLGLGSLPTLLKHGTVKKVTQAQYDEIKAKWG